MSQHTKQLVSVTIILVLGIGGLFFAQSIFLMANQIAPTTTTDTTTTTTTTIEVL